MPNSWSFAPRGHRAKQVDRRLSPELVAPEIESAGVGRSTPELVAIPADSDFDPYDHTIKEVQEYVGAHPGQFDEIYLRERGGRARVTLLAWMQDQGQ